MPPRRRGSVGSSTIFFTTTSPPFRLAPSATTMMLKFFPADRSSRISRAMASTVKGISGKRMTSAPPARPENRAIHPALRPMTSTTITRPWLSAVVRIRSMASVAMPTAVSNPNVTSVARRSLSIVLGTQIAGRPFWVSW